MEDVTRSDWWKNLQRLASESRSTAVTALLKKIGLAVHDIRCNLPTDTFPITVASTQSGSILDEEHWRLPVKPADLEVQCVSKTEIFVDSVTVFAEIENDSFQFLETASPKVVSWTEQLAKQDSDGMVTLPKLQPGVSRRVHFTAVERIGPEQAYIAKLLSMASAEKEAIIGAMLAMKLAGLPPTLKAGASSSTNLAYTLWQLADRLASIPEELRVTLLLVLHDGTVAPFRWNNGRFEKDFFTGGITTV